MRWEETIRDGGRVSVDVFVFKLISRVNVIKSLKFKFPLQYFIMKNIS